MQITGKKLLILMLLICFMLTTIQNSHAATGGEINANVESTLERFYSEVKNGRDVVKDAKGVLVFPNVYKAGFVVGGEYGEGALRIGNKTIDYYNLVTGSFGFQLGIQKKSVIILFMEDGALNHFRQSSNWKAGVDASITVIAIGADGSIDTSKLNKPILAFIIGQKGLMYNLTLEGSKFTKIKK